MVTHRAAESDCLALLQSQRRGSFVVFRTGDALGHGNLIVGKRGVGDNGDRGFAGAGTGEVDLAHRGALVGRPLVDLILQVSIETGGRQRGRAVRDDDSVIVAVELIERGDGLV
ncbi:hypothetical protein CLAC_03230 [Corynebacterium lactis RW2-5]|uniref:Uncharacterized protein n=1 Tax=Corynebacterium lactis RW2-5 TaxID=1408189 RepID=A0A0K2GZL8_9CORY|nr:hypothetical protein CLAC_03230 [Corynebacterium lactis RW2-5]